MRSLSLYFKAFVLLILCFHGLAIGSARFSVVPTGSAQMPEAMVYSGGSLTKLRTMAQSAFLIHSNNEYLLFETGLGRHIDEQRDKSVPWWKRWLFPYNKGKSASKWIGDEIKVSKIFLSHTHWDHAGGIEDFPNAEVFLHENEIAAFKLGPDEGRFPVQIDLERVKTFTWKEAPFLGFSKHYDVYGDKEVVLVPLPGHSPGQIGLYLKTNGAEYLFVGDSVWLREQIELEAPKSFLASSLVDADKEVTKDTIQKLKHLSQNRNIIMVPTHDSKAQKDLKHYPDWN